MPDVWIIDSVKHEIREPDRIHHIVLLATVKGAVLQCVEFDRRDFVSRLVAHVLIRLREKSTCAATGIVNCFPDLRINHAHHRANDFARREKLTAVISAFTHL